MAATAAANGGDSMQGEADRDTTPLDVPQSPSYEHAGDMTIDTSSECSALLAWVQAVDRAGASGLSGAIFTKAIEDIADLCDGTVFFELLSTVDGEYFRNPHQQGAGVETDNNWVLRTATLKRLYKLIVQYYTEVLRQSPQALTVPDLDALARDASHDELARLGRFVLGIAIRSERASEHITAIQTLDLAAQQQLMQTIEQVMSALQPLDAIEEGARVIKSSSSQETLSAGDVALAAEKQKFERAYQELLEKQRTLQSSLDDVTAERDDAQKELQLVKDGAELGQPSTSEKHLRQDIDRLKDELRKSEDNCAEAERSLQRLQSSVGDVNKRNNEMQALTEENTRLKDQVEELRHAAEKLQRTENVMEKYKKKLEESSEVRRQLKTLEEQNTELIERNSTLEDDYRRVAHFKPLMDQYKTQMSELEAKTSELQRDLNAARYEAEQTSAKLRATEETRTKENEELDLYQERVQELELGGALPKRNQARGAVNGVDGLAEANEAGSDEDGVGETLQDAMSGMTMTGLKIQLRKLRSELAVAQANKADASKLLVTENLLQDAQAMKDRYEKNYLREYQTALKLRRQLDEIQGGKSSLGDGSAANAAMRIRLSEAVTELDETRKKLVGVENDYSRASNDLAIAKADLNLVGKDKRDMIAEARASVGAEKAELERRLSQMRKELDAKDQEALMQLSQINSLLLDKVNLQSDGLEQRDGALQRQLEMDAMRQKDQGVPEDAQRQPTQQTEEISALKEKLAKARAFVRQQDRLLKEAGNMSSAASSSAAGEDDATATANAKRVATLEQENKIVRQELRLMTVMWHDLNTRHMRTIGGNALSKGAASLAASMSASNSSASSRAHTRANVELNGTHNKSWLLQRRSELAPGISLSRR